MCLVRSAPCKHIMPIDAVSRDLARGCECLGGEGKEGVVCQRLMRMRAGPRWLKAKIRLIKDGNQIGDVAEITCDHPNQTFEVCRRAGRSTAIPIGQPLQKQNP